MNEGEGESSRVQFLFLGVHERAVSDGQLRRSFSILRAVITSRNNNRQSSLFGIHSSLFLPMKLGKIFRNRLGLNGDMASSGFSPDIT